MDVREKLVELMDEAKRQWQGGTNNIDGRIADHLIANGVTVQDNKEITDELLKQLRNAPVTILQEEPTIEVVQKWISVKDRLPEKWQDIIAYDAKNQEIHLAYMTEDAWVGVRMNGKVTHWMPLPEPPKGE